MNAGHTVRSDTKHPASSHVSTRLWNLPAYGKPLRSAPFHRPWKTPPSTTRVFHSYHSLCHWKKRSRSPMKNQAPSTNPTLISPGTKTGVTSPSSAFGTFSPGKKRRGRRTLDVGSVSHLGMTPPRSRVAHRHENDAY